MTVKFVIPFGMKLWGWMNSLLLIVVDLLNVWFQLSGSFQFCAPKSVCLKRTNLDISQSKTQHKVRLFLQPPNHRLRWQSFRLHGIGQSLRSACEWGNPNGGRLLIWGMSCGFVVLCYRGNSHEKNVGAIRVGKAEHFCQQEREKYPCVPYRCFVSAPFELLYLAYECIWPYDCHPLVTEVNGKPRVLIKQDYMSFVCFGTPISKWKIHHL